MGIAHASIGRPWKLSGIVSCKASFPYDQGVVDAIKALPGPCVWHKRECAWEAPEWDIPEFLDIIACRFPIELSVEQGSGAPAQPPLSEEEISSLKVRPFAHQIEAVNYGLGRRGWLLLDSMGLGKTAESIYLAETLRRRGLIGHCLVVCGVDSLRQNWKAEIRKFSDLPAVVLGERVTRNGTVRYEPLAKRAEQLRNPIGEFFVIVNITNVGDDRFVEAFRKSANEFGMIIFDECHRATKGSARGANLLKLDAEYKVAMTGTLIVNSPISAYLPLAWTGNDRATLTNFKAQYCNFGGFGGNQIVGYKNLEALNEEIRSCSLRRTFDQVRGDMPKKTVEYELVEMSDADQRFYDAIRDGVREEADKIELNANNLLALMTRLRQATSAPAVLTTDPPESSKLARAAELAEDLIEAGEKVVVMANFKESVYGLAARLGRFRPFVCTGDQREDAVQRDIDDFRKGGAGALIATHAKIGTGFSMPEAHYMIMVDTPYTAAATDQSCDRIYRITSDQPVYVKILCCKGTVDERVREIVESKKDLAEYMVDGKPSARFADELRSIIREI